MQENLTGRPKPIFAAKWCWEDQLKRPFYLWTRQAVVALAKREFAVVLPATTVGRYLKAWGLTPQKPVRRAYERNDAAIDA